MKIAVLIAGEWRSGFDTYPYLSTFFEKNQKHDIDYFIYTYIHNEFRKDIRELPTIRKDLGSREIKNIQLLYNPKKIRIDENRCDYQVYLNCPFYAFKICNDLKNEYKRETGVKYDYVIKVRPDLIFYYEDTPELPNFSDVETDLASVLFRNKKSFDMCINILNKSNTHFITFQHWQPDWRENLNILCMHDLYHMGNEKIMDSLANIKNIREDEDTLIYNTHYAEGVPIYRWAYENKIEQILGNPAHIERYTEERGNDFFPSDYISILEEKNKLMMGKTSLKESISRNGRITETGKKWILSHKDNYESLI